MPRQIMNAQDQQQAATLEEVLADRVRNGKLVPVIGNTVGNELVFGGQKQVTQKYAEYSKYPLSQQTLPEIAQYRSTFSPDEVFMKKDYVNFVKNLLYDMAEAEHKANKGIDKDSLDVVLDKFDDLLFSSFAEQLGFPRYDNAREHPLLLLASMNLPIYVTTCYHDFIESALRYGGKEPQTEVCRWHSGLKDIPSGLKSEISAQKPLVYHLHGFDRYPDSLVLTEEDYLRFLLAARQDIGRNTDTILKKVRGAMSDSSLLLLGYSLSDWDFRTVFWGLIEPRAHSLTSGVSIQLERKPKEEEYLNKYFSEYDFGILWESTLACVKNLFALMNPTGKG
jgi:hypothetical protein